MDGAAAAAVEDGELSEGAAERERLVSRCAEDGDATLGRSAGVAETDGGPHAQPPTPDGPDERRGPTGVDGAREPAGAGVVGGYEGP